MADQLVGAVPGEVFGTLADILLKLKAGALTAEELKLFAKHENPFTVGNFKRDMRKEGWTLLENQPRRLSSAIIGVSFLRDSESSVNGEEMARRALGLDANYGQEDAEWLLEHQDLIPVELRKFYLVFPGTKWQSRDGHRHVPFLFWSGDRWILVFSWLDDGFSSFVSFVRLVSPRKPA